MESATTIVRQFKDTKLFITDLQNEYTAKVGLSLNGTLSEKDADLPLHPRALQSELDDYKDHYSKLKRDLVEQATKKSFLQSIRQDRPPSITDHDIYPLEKMNKTLKDDLKRAKDETRIHKLNVEEFCYSIDRSWQTMQERVDDVKRLVDECHQKEADLARINALVSNQSLLSLEEAKDILARQVGELRQLETEISEQRETLEELEYRVEDSEHRANVLQRRSAVAQEEAAEAVRQCENRDEMVEERARWYTSMTDMCNKLLGIDRIEFISRTLVIIFFAAPYHEQLRIELDPLSQFAVDATLTSRSGLHPVNIKDLIAMAKTCQPKDAIKLIVLETLSRLKKQMH